MKICLECCGRHSKCTDAKWLWHTIQVFDWNWGQPCNACSEQPLGSDVQCSDTTTCLAHCC